MSYTPPTPEVLVPFASSLSEDAYRLWVTYAYWERLNLQDVLADALRTHLHDNPSAHRELPRQKEAALGWKIQKARKS